MIRTVLAYAFLGLAMFFLLPLLILWTLITKNADAEFFPSMRAIALSLRIAKIHVRVEGRENIPPVACVFVSNHASNLDPLVLFPVVGRRISVLIKKELMRIPILATGMRLANFVAVDRADRKAAAASLERCLCLLRDGLSFVIFAEGTRSPDGRLLPFKRGALLLAIQAGAPIVPVAIGGTHRLMRKGHWAIQPGEVTVRFGAPIDPSQFATRRGGRDLLGTIESAVAAALPPDQQPLSPSQVSPA